MLTQAEQGTVWKAGLAAGYRYAPAKIVVSGCRQRSGRRMLTVETEWSNTGVAPTYRHWRIEYRLRAASPAQATPMNSTSANMSSTVDLRQVLPGSDATYNDRFELPPDLRAGTYELDVRVVDENGYLEPMQLALADREDRGFYRLGRVTISN